MVITMKNNGGGSSTGNKKRLSDARRERLQQEVKETLTCVSSFFPIERYYEVAEKLYDELKPIALLVQGADEANITMEELKKYEDDDDDNNNNNNKITTEKWQYCETFNKGLDMTYLYAKRYCTLCVEAIPTHNYYNAIQYQSLKQRHALRMDRVINLLERTADQMDVQEQILLLLQTQKDRHIQQQLIQRHQDLNNVGDTNSSSRSIPTTGSSNRTLSVEESALEKLKVFVPPSTIPSTTDDTPTNRNSSTTRYHFTDDSDTSTDTNNETSLPNYTAAAALSLHGIQPLLPPGTTTTTTTTNNYHQNDTVVPLVPPTPPTYEAVVSAMQNRKNRPTKKDTSYIRPPPPPVERPEQPLSKPNKEIVQRPPPMRQLQEYYKTRYMKYQQLGKIQISPIDTYQGRISESTNGCTVISALIAARHLQESQPYTMISNTTIQSVIDTQCGPILRTIRKQLGLGGHALIIPSDVHDHLVDAKILLQEQFTGAAGGNIMNQQHYNEFLQLLSDMPSSLSSSSSDPSPSTTKVTSNGKAGATFFFREHVVSILKSIDPNTQRSYYDLIDSMPGIIQNGKSMATRTRCTDMESFEVLLLWYASRKFSDSNCIYIDRNPWNDSTADLDPRVFQGFVWSS